MMESNWRTKRSYPAASPARAVIALATPVLPPEASAQAKSGSVVPVGLGDTGGAETRGPEALAAPVPAGVTAAEGARLGPQATRIEIKTRPRPIRTGQWYGREPFSRRR